MASQCKNTAGDGISSNTASFPVPKVTDFASLPAPGSVPIGQLYYVQNQTGSYLLFTRKKRGLYESDGAQWKYAGDNTRDSSEHFFDNSVSSLPGAPDNVQDAIDAVAASASGEVNTASNVNTGGVGVFKQKTGVDLEFRGVNAASSKVSVALDAANNEIDVDVVEANIDHTAIANIGTNSHAAIDTHIADTANPHDTTVSNLNDTSITAAARGDVLAYDGSNWVDAQAAVFMVQFARNGATTANQWLRGAPDSHQTADAPVLFPFDVKLIAITTTTRDVETWDAEVYNGTVSRVGGTPLVGSALAVVNNVAVNSSNNAFNVDIASGTEIAVYLRGTGVSRPHVQLWFVRRV
jgi:hypothetical protein